MVAGPWGPRLIGQIDCCATAQKGRKSSLDLAKRTLFAQLCSFHDLQYIT